MKHTILLSLLLLAGCSEQALTPQPMHSGILCAITSDGAWYTDTLRVETVCDGVADTVVIYPHKYSEYQTGADSVAITGYTFYRYEGYNYCLVVDKRTAIPIEVRK